MFTFFYSTLFFIEAWFRKVGKRVKPLYIILFLAALAVSVFIVSRNDSHIMIMQRHKFPPNYQYMIYSLPYVSLFVLIKRMWPLENVNPNLVTEFIEWCSFNIFEIYLVHSFVAHFPFYFVPELLPHFSVVSVYCIVLAFNMGVSLALVYIYQKVILECKTAWNRHRSSAR